MAKVKAEQQSREQAAKRKRLDEKGQKDLADYKKQLTKQNQMIMEMVKKQAPKVNLNIPTPPMPPTVYKSQKPITDPKLVLAHKQREAKIKMLRARFEAFSKKVVKDQKMMNTQLNKFNKMQINKVTKVSKQSPYAHMPNDLTPEQQEAWQKYQEEKA